MRRKIFALGTMVLLSPLGILLPAWFKAGSAWGEWSNEDVAQLFGRVPTGLQHLSTLWQAPIPDYGYPGWDPILATVCSASLGVLVLLAMGWGLGILLIKQKAL